MMAGLIDHVYNHPVLLLAFGVLLYSFYTRIKPKTAIPDGVPWVGKPKYKWFSEFRAILGSLTKCRPWMQEGYHQFLKKEKAYIMPDPGGNSSVIVPRSQISWLVNQPDNVLSTSAFHYDCLEGDWLWTDRQILSDPYHEHVIHKYLPRRLNGIVDALQEDVEPIVDAAWGTDTQWKEVSLQASLMEMIGSFTQHIFVGLPLSRDKKYLQTMSSFTMDVVTSTNLLGFVPRWARPLVGHLIAIPIYLRYRTSAKYTKPLIAERLALKQRKLKDPSFKWEEPNDYLSWHIDLAMAENRQDELTVKRISQRMLPISFAALHTTLLTATNLFLDLSSADPQYMIQIREEVQAVFAEEGGQRWSKSALNKLAKADSAIRESMRLNNFMAKNTSKKVVAKEGIMSADEKWHAPYGAFLAADMDSIHHDPEIYEDPDVYDPFRFSKVKEASQSAPGDIEKPAERVSSDVQLKKTDLISTSDAFLAFSHGRHACPGRFFVALELKILMAYIFTNYEIEHLKDRPPNFWFGFTLIPPLKAKIRVRRRPGTPQPTGNQA